MSVVGCLLLLPMPHAARLLRFSLGGKSRVRAGQNRSCKVTRWLAVRNARYRASNPFVKKLKGNKKMKKETKHNATHFSREAEPKTVERVHWCVRMGLRGNNPSEYDAELVKLIDDLGIDFVCKHACENTWWGGKECASGHCKWPDGHETTDLDAGDEKCTCREAMRGYIEHCMGYPESFLRIVK
jgi:hypothetical protein